MIFWGKERRNGRRYPVNWSGALIVDSADLREIQPVRIADLSASGARFLIPRVYFRGRYLLSERRAARLMLRMELPETPHGDASSWVQRISVRWYRWSVSEKAFEIAVEFIDLSHASRKLLDALIQGLKKKKSLPPGSVFHRIFLLLTG
ncbi:MAG: hypothetical protein ACLFRG_10260 [Desulfococcaceae bacterium]